MISMQVGIVSNKPYRYYFDVIETSNVELVCPYGIGSFCIAKVFFLSLDIRTEGNMRTKKDFNRSEQTKLKNVIFEKTGYRIRNNCLLYQIFTRSSFSAEQGGECNEVLEFIGDQVLSFYVVKNIAEHCGIVTGEYEYRFGIRENRFTVLKQEFVSNKTLAHIMDEWGIAEYLIVGKADFQNEIDKQIKVKADLFEAVLGAIAVESKWNEKVLEKAVEKMLSMEEKISSLIETDNYPIQFDMETAIGTLKELAEHGKCSVPEYKFSTPEQVGYDQNGNPIWSCTCSVINDRTAITRLVFASDKKTAKKAASYLVLCKHFGLQNKYGKNGNFGVWIYRNDKLMPEHLIKD